MQHKKSGTYEVYVPVSWLLSIFPSDNQNYQNESVKIRDLQLKKSPICSDASWVTAQCKSCM